MEDQRWRRRNAYRLTQLVIDSIVYLPQPDASLLNARAVHVADASRPNDPGVNSSAAENLVLDPVDCAVPLATANKTHLPSNAEAIRNDA